MMDIGKMDYLVIFEEPNVSDDGYGNTTDGWTNPVAADAAFRFLRGGETVQAARLSGRQPIVVTVHHNSLTRAVTTDWRMKNARTGEIFNIRSGPVPTDNYQFIEFTVEGGVAT
jgi:head-tail adaptor